MWILNRACTLAYELAFLLLIVLVLIAPLHAFFTTHIDVVQTIDDSHAIISGNLQGLKAGETLALYRFNYDWKLPIGVARVESVSGSHAEIAVNPSEMRWPLGIEGVLSREADGSISANVGSSAGVAAGDTLNIFRNRVVIGQAEVTRAQADKAELVVPADIGDPSGLLVSGFVFTTQAPQLENGYVAFAEGAFILAAVMGYAVAWIFTRRSPFITAGIWLRRAPLRTGVFFWIVNGLAGIPFTWFMAKMPLYLLAYVLGWFNQLLTGHSIYLRPLADSMLPFAYVGIALAYYGYLVWKRKSPILAFWNAISYKKQSPVKTVTWKRGIFLWALHLVVVYAFASTLFAFLYGDIAAAGQVLNPLSSFGAFSEWAKYSLWALTVVGCLLGYGYSIVSILWGTYIRNLDFTITGWLTNGFCYPFLGVVIWQMTPAFTGPDPIITQGPAYVLMLVLGLWFNLLYMLSIWNLGTLFDLMTDKGVRTSAFYSVVRHPNYSLEVSMFFVTEMIGLSGGVQWLAIMMYFFIYWIRSEREDNFMGYSNPAYAPYREQTPYKFLPGIY